MAAAMHGFLHAVWTVVVWILLVVLELFVAALIVAPRWVARKLATLLRAPARQVQRVLRRPSPRREAARPSREGA
ncbi:MAG: hypothetical protein ACXVHB_32780 [Solirubrobacteraceae bacterium]